MIGRIFAGLLFSVLVTSYANSQTIDLSSLNADVETGIESATGLSLQRIKFASGVRSWAQTNVSINSCQ